MLPFFGLELLNIARDVAAFNLPARVAQLLRGQPLAKLRDPDRRVFSRGECSGSAADISLTVAA